MKTFVTKVWHSSSIYEKLKVCSLFLFLAEKVLQILKQLFDYDFCHNFFLVFANYAVWEEDKIEIEKPIAGWEICSSLKSIFCKNQLNCSLNSFLVRYTIKACACSNFGIANEFVLLGQRLASPQGLWAKTA